MGEQAELTAAIDASLAGVDVLAGPTVGYQAPEQDPPFGLGDDNAEGRFTGPYNLTGHPAVSLPAPAAGLPVGLQLAGRRGSGRDPAPRRRGRRAPHRPGPLRHPEPRPVSQEGLTMPTTVLRRTLDLAGLDVPVVELTGAGDGPRLTVIAGVHGCEYASMAAVRRWSASLAGRELRGSVRAVPVLNLPAFRARSPFVIPAGRQEPEPVLSRRPGGTLADRLAHAAFTQLITGSDALIDAHCGDLPEALEPFALYEAGPSEDQALALAVALRARLHHQAGGRARAAPSAARRARRRPRPASRRSRPRPAAAALIEQAAVDLHVAGLDRVLAALGMTGAAADGQAGPADPAALSGTGAAPTVLSRFIWLRSDEAGWWQPAVRPGRAGRRGPAARDGQHARRRPRSCSPIMAPAAGVPMFITSSPAVEADGLLLGLGAP